MNRLLIFIFLLILSGCSKPKNTIPRLNHESDLEITTNSLHEIDRANSQGRKGKIISGFFYRCNPVSGLDFIKKGNSEILKSDLMKIRNESVFIFEIETETKMKQILDSPKLQLDKEDVMKYLSGEVMNDFEIIQNNKVHAPTGALFEGIIGDGSALRIYFFMKNIALNEAMTIRFYDRLFGAGFIRITKNDTIKLSV